MFSRRKANKGGHRCSANCPTSPERSHTWNRSDCGRSPPPGSDETSNEWPELPEFRADVRACWDQLTAAGNAVLQGLALANGFRAKRLRPRCISQQLNTMRLLHYPQNDAPESDANVGISAHTDFECVTLILQTAPGLGTTGGRRQLVRRAGS